MLYFLAKVILSAIIIALVSTAAARKSLFAAMMASIPLVSLLSFVWIYIETGDLDGISRLSRQIFWLVLPSLAFFLLLPVMIRYTGNFFLSLAVSLCVTAAAYAFLVLVLGRTRLM